MLKRILTAVCILPIFIYLLYTGGMALKLLTLAIIFIASYELKKMMQDLNLISLGSLFIGEGIMMFGNGIAGVQTGLAFIIGVNVIYFLYKYSGDREENMRLFNGLLGNLFAYLYVGIALINLVKIRSLESGFELLFFMFIVIWATDSFAYFSGVKFGKNKLAPLISPKKTIEGSVGGVLSALILSYFANNHFHIFESDFKLLTIVLLVSIISQVGDLFESSLKRIYQIKDSGNILPGHGGILDRFDSTIFVAPLFYFLVKFIG